MIDQKMIDCWRISYGLDTRSPADAAKWWGDMVCGLVPAGCVAALGLALNELEGLRKEAERQSTVIAKVNARCDHLGIRLGEVMRERDELLALVAAERERVPERDETTDKAAMPASCPTATGCREHGCHGACFGPNARVQPLP
jgi:hypothetical protein